VREKVIGKGEEEEERLFERATPFQDLEIFECEQRIAYSL